MLASEVTREEEPKLERRSKSASSRIWTPCEELGFGGLGGGILVLIGPSVSEAEAEAVVEAGLLETISRMVYDFRVIREGVCSPNLHVGIASGLVDPGSCREWVV